VKRGAAAVVSGVVMVLVVVGGLVGYRLWARVRVDQYVAALRPLVDAYGEAFAAAGRTTNREDLADAIAELEAVRAEVRELEPPRPADQVHYLAMRAMNYGVEAYWGQMAGAPATYVEGKADLSEAWSRDMAVLSAEVTDAYRGVLR